MNPITAAKAKQHTATGKKTSALTVLVKYQQPVFKAGKEVEEFTYRGDQQMQHFKTINQIIALSLTLHTEITKNRVAEYAIYDNRPEAPPYPENIIIHKLAGVIMHDNTSRYPNNVFEILQKYNLI